jgi:hypothetical protein
MKASNRGSELDRRYLFIGGGCSAGGWFTKLGPNRDVKIPVPSIAPVHLPLVGGLSESQSGPVSICYEASHFPGVPKKLLKDVVGRELFSIESAKCSVRSSRDENRRVSIATYSEASKMRFKEGFYLEYGNLNMETSQGEHDEYPTIRIGPSQLTGLTLGGKPLTITLDTDTLNRYPTMKKLKSAFETGKKKSHLLHTFTQKKSKLVTSPGNYVTGSLVTSIQGELPPGAYIEPNGYTINWPAFGKIILGEILISSFLRRVALVRLKLCNFEGISGCGGGSYWPG